MHSPMGLTFRSREFLAITTAILLVLAVATVADLTTVARVTLRSASEEGELSARQLFHLSAREIENAPTSSLQALRSNQGIRALLEGIVGYSHTVVYAAIVDPTGRAEVHSDPAQEGKLLPARESLKTVSARGMLRIMALTLGDLQVYETQLPIRLGQRPFGTVRVGISTSLLRREMTQALLQSLVLAGVILAVAVAAGLGAGRALLQSVRRISRKMERLTRGGRGAAVDLTRDDELGELAARVNRLGERIHTVRSRAPGEKTLMDGMVSSLEDAVIFLNRNREVIFCNQAAEGMLDRRLEEVVGYPLESLLPGDHPLLAVVADLFETGQGCRNVSLKARWPDGRTWEFAVSSYRIHEADEVGGGILALKDLDPVRAVQSLVTYSQKLAALGRLTSGVAHEVKNPLNAMRIHLELLKTRLTGERPQVRENLDVIGQEIQRLDRVVQGFLKFMRPQNLHLQRVDVNAILSGIVHVTSPEAAHAKVRIALDLEPDLPAVMGDAQLLQQACANVVANATEAMPRGGTVIVATRRLPLGAIEVRVKDDGVGIPSQDLENIFRLYFTTKPNGSGIGLSLVYRIVQMHEGRVDVESAVGRGTTVTLTLPLAPMSLPT